MKLLSFAFLAFFALTLSGCVSAPSELYGIHQAKPEKAKEANFSFSAQSPAAKE